MCSLERTPPKKKENVHGTNEIHHWKKSEIQLWAHLYFNDDFSATVAGYCSNKYRREAYCNSERFTGESIEIWTFDY